MSIIKFRGLRPMTESEADNLRNINHEDIGNGSVKEDSPLRAIFAPDPVTGNPASDLYFDCKNNNELRQYINDELQAFTIPVPKTDDASVALEVQKSIFESRDAYVQRIRDFVTKQSESK